MDSNEGSPRRKPNLIPGSARVPIAPTPDAGLTEVQRLAGLIHEMRNLLDGSLRYVLLARRALMDSSAEPPIMEVSRQLDVATHAMERMSSLAHAAMLGPNLSIGSMLQPDAATVPLGEAVRHAAEVIRPRAEEHRVTIKTCVSPRLVDLPAGALYTLFLNTLRNAVDANVRAGGLGVVEVSIAPTPAPSKEDDRLWMSIDIRDEGEGILPQVAARAFEYAYSGTTFGTGIGLAVARSVVEEMGGTIGIATRKDRGVITRPGACVHAVIPVPVPEDKEIGGRGA